MTRITTSQHSAETAAPSVRPIERGTGLRDSVTERLLVAILDRSVQQGHRFVGQRLAAQLGVSATPVREALIELASLGFVELLPNRGAVCREFGPKELGEIFQVRRVLEAEAAFGASGRVPVEELERLRSWMAKLSETVETDEAWSDHAMEADIELHRLIQGHCESSRYNALMRAIRRVAVNIYNVQLRAVGEHLRIIDALLAEDAELARTRMSEHIDSTARGVAKVMFQESGA